VTYNATPQAPPVSVDLGGMTHPLGNQDMAKLVRTAGWRGGSRPSPGRILRT
jgi:hypothetical protein